MDANTEIMAFSDDLDRLVQRYKLEFDLSFASVVGALEAKKWFLIQEAQQAYAASGEVRICANCRHCVKHDPEFSTGWECKAVLRNVIDGHVIRPNGEMPVWAARDQYCGVNGLYYEPI